MSYKNKFGVDGLMIGRASIGNPWFFNQVKHFLKTGEHLQPPTLEDKIKTVTEHLAYSIRWKGERLGILEMRRHYANYFKGIPDFKQYRIKLVTLESQNEIMDTLSTIDQELTINVV